MTTRRSFLAALAAVPIAGVLVAHHLEQPYVLQDWWYLGENDPEVRFETEFPPPKGSHFYVTSEWPEADPTHWGARCLLRAYVDGQPVRFRLVLV